MQTAMIEDILAAHADALNQGVDNTEWLCERYDTAHQHHLADLLNLARVLKRHLVPQSARPEFATQLRADLVRQSAPPPAEEDRRWLMRLALFLFSLVVGGLGWLYWRRSTTTQTSQTAADPRATPFF